MHKSSTEAQSRLAQALFLSLLLRIDFRTGPAAESHLVDGWPSQDVHPPTHDRLTIRPRQRRILCAVAFYFLLHDNIETLSFIILSSFRWVKPPPVPRHRPIGPLSLGPIVPTRYIIRLHSLSCSSLGWLLINMAKVYFLRSQMESSIMPHLHSTMSSVHKILRSLGICRAEA